MDEDTERDNRTKRQPTGDYGVGYCRPPESTRFKKGESGNRKGRTKGAKNAATCVKSVFQQKVKLRKGKKVSRVSSFQALLEGMMADAIRGDHKARTEALKVARSAGLLEP